MEKLIPILCVIAYSFIICIPVFLHWNKKLVVFVLICGMIGIIPIEYAYFKHREPIETYERNPRLVSVKTTFNKKDTVLQILIPYVYGQKSFKKGKKVILFRTFYSTDKFLKEITLDMLKSRSRDHEYNDISVTSVEDKYLFVHEGIVLYKSFANSAYEYHIGQVATVIYDPKSN